MPVKRNLTSKQLKFIAAYDGNGTKAARAAGYKGGDNALGVMANSLLRNHKIKAAIQARQAKVERPLIATREQRQAFWTQVFNGLEGGATMSDRLRASELLGKSEADFTEKTQVSGPGGGPQVIITLPDNGYRATEPCDKK